jgi:hypothetical protein
MHCRLAIVAIPVLGFLLACSEMRNSTGTISKRIGDLVHEQKATTIELGSLTSFGWEYFFAFPPGTTREEVCALIQAGRNVCGRIIRIERAPDDHMFLLFGLNGNLTHVELHAVKNGRFDITFTGAGHPRSKSTFRVRRSSTSGTTDNITLEPTS